MIGWRSFPGVAAVALAASLGSAQAELPNGVKTLEPAGAIKAEGTWSLGARAGDFIFVAGTQGVDPATNKLVEDPQARIRRAFLNIKTIAESEVRASKTACGSQSISAICLVSRLWWRKRKPNYGVGHPIRPEP